LVETCFPDDQKAVNCGIDRIFRNGHFLFGKWALFVPFLQKFCSFKIPAGFNFSG